MPKKERLLAATMTFVFVFISIVTAKHPPVAAALFNYKFFNTTGCMSISVPQGFKCSHHSKFGITWRKCI